MEPTSLYIEPRQCKYVTGNISKAKPAVEAVEAVKGQKEIKDDEGNIIQPEIKAVKAVEAKPATEQIQVMWIWSKSEKIRAEVEKRMIHAGVQPLPFSEDYPEYIDKLGENFIFRGFDVSHSIGQAFVVNHRSVFQEAFKKVKSKEHYNKAGWAIVHADNLEKKRIENAKKKKEKTAKEEAENVDKAAKKTSETGKKASKKTAAKKSPKKTATKDTNKDDGDDWGE